MDKTSQEATPQDTKSGNSSDSPKVTEKQRQERGPGRYYAPLWWSPITKNVGFIAVEELICETKTEAKRAAREYQQRMKSQWGMEWLDQRLKTLDLPMDTAKYPLFSVNQGGTILPFAAVEGPMYDDEIKKRGGS